MPRRFQLTMKKKWVEKRHIRKGEVSDKFDSKIVHFQRNSNTYAVSLQVTAPSPPTLRELHGSIPPLGSDWCDQSQLTDQPTQQIRLCKVTSRPQASQSTEPLVISHSLLVDADLSWRVFIHGHRVDKSTSNSLAAVPDHLDSSAFAHLLSILQSVNVCPGQPNPRYIEMAVSRKGTFTGPDGDIKATLETSFQVTLKGKVFPSTIRTTKCEVLTDARGSTCSTCRGYGSTLQAMYSRWTKRDSELASLQTTVISVLLKNSTSSRSFRRGPLVQNKR